jgi:hypothetical protein
VFLLWGGNKMKQNTVTQEQVDNIFLNSELNYSTLFGKCTVLTCQLPNGFIIVESSACVDPVNFDETIGADICNERVKNKIWELEGYYLQSELAEANRPVECPDVILPASGLSFGQAIEALKVGSKLARAGWNGKRMFLYYVPANSYAAQTEVAQKEFGPLVAYGAYIAMKTATGEVVPWLASQTDVLAEDWEIV